MGNHDRCDKKTNSLTERLPRRSLCREMFASLKAGFTEGAEECLNVENKTRACAMPHIAGSTASVA